jgi:hypothetical protein
MPHRFATYVSIPVQKLSFWALFPLLQDWSHAGKFNIVDKAWRSSWCVEEQQVVEDSAAIAFAAW